MTWPVPSQPGVGHLISRFSGLEGSRDCGERVVGSRSVIWKGRGRKITEHASYRFSSQTQKPLGLEFFFTGSGIITLEISKIQIGEF